MHLYKHWLFLILAWLLSSVSIRIWPEMTSLDLGLKEDLMAALLFKPFHYLISFFFLIFVLVMLFDILGKVLYEYKIAFLLKVFPYEPFLLHLISGLVYWKIVRFFPYLVIGLTIILAIYHLVNYLLERRKDIVYVREN